MKLILGVILLMWGLFFNVEAMSENDQNLAAVSVYKNAFDSGLVSCGAMKHVQNSDRSDITMRSRRGSRSRIFGNMTPDERVKIDLNHLFTMAVIKSWKESFRKKNPNTQYTEFLEKYEFSPYDLDALYEILDEAQYEKVPNYETLRYLKDSAEGEFFSEIISEHLTRLGFKNTSYEISKKDFNEFYGNKKLHRKTYMAIREYQKEIKDEAPKNINKSRQNRWIIDLYRDALEFNLISEKERKRFYKMADQDKVRINAKNILILALFQADKLHPEFYDFLVRRGIYGTDFFRLNVTIKNLFRLHMRVSETQNQTMRISEFYSLDLNVLEYISDIITRNLKRIGIRDKIYYISKSRFQLGELK